MNNAHGNAHFCVLWAFLLSFHGFLKYLWAADSAMDENGYYYTRGSKLTDNEAKQIVQSSGLNGKDLEAFETGG